MNTLQKFESKQLSKLQEIKKIPPFSAGDSLKVNVKIKEGERERILAYEGVCVGRAGSGLNENFTVRKISYGEGVERVFPIWSPVVDSIEVTRRGSVRRAKLYYLRDRRGKSARIDERTTGHGFDEETLANEAALKAELKEKEAAAKKARKEAAANAPKKPAKKK